MRFKKLISAVTAAAMTLSMAAGSMAMLSSTVSAAGSQTAIDLVDDMGLGWNLGNTFDCWGITWTDETWTGWGNITPTQDMITAIHAAGFNSVRVPITWYQHTDSSFDIDDAYLAEIKKVVDYAYNEGMYVIINMHWDWVSDGSLWLNKGEAALPQFTAMWTEIANYFKDYDNHLVYEGMNEVTFDYSVLNNFNQKFVDTVRAAGGNNEKRLLLLPGKNTNLDDTCKSDFVVPDDEMVAVSIHFYLPPQFTVGTKNGGWGYADNWGTDAEKQELYNNFNKMKSTFVDNGVPVILGEYGAVTNDGKDADSIKSFLQEVASTSLATSGISAYLWDSGNGGDMQYFNRKTLTWFDPAIGEMFKNVSPNAIEYVAKNRVTLDMTGMTADEYGRYHFDLTPYAGQGATIKQILLQGDVTGDGVGFGIAFDAFRDGADEAQWSAETGVLGSDGELVVDLDGTAYDDDVEYSYVLDMNYLDVQQWWTESNDATASLKSLTLVFDKEITVVDDNTTPTETTAPTESDTTEPDTTETDTTEADTSEPDTTEAPEVKEPEGLYVALEGQYGGNGFWDPIYFVDKIPEKGTGNYSITVDKTGTTKDGDLILFLESNINIYDYKTDPDAEGTNGLTDGNIKFEITSILVDGTEVEYTPADPGTSDDGKSLRQNIYNSWAKVKSIDPDITISEGITVNFTLTLGDGSEEQPAGICGDVNNDGSVDIMDVISLNKYLLSVGSLENPANAETNGDGEVNSVDALNILKAVAKLITLPVA